jgi:hypothetical protein
LTAARRLLAATALLCSTSLAWSQSAPPDGSPSPTPPDAPFVDPAPQSEPATPVADLPSHEPSDDAPRAAIALPPLPSASAPTEQPTPTFTGAPGKGITLTVGDRFAMNVRTRMQLRWMLHAAPEVMGDRKFEQLVGIGTARVWISGHAFVPRMMYMLHLALAGGDYRDGTVSPIYDAFIDYKAHRELSIKAGQYFVPFDRMRTVRDFAQQLAARPRPILELTLDRDVGVTAYSEHAFLGTKSPLAWRVSAFGGGGMNVVTAKTPGVLLVGRVELRPLGEIDDDSEGDLKRHRDPGLAIGAGIATNRNTNRQRSTTGTTFTGGTVDFMHYALDLSFKWRGIGAMFEYVKASPSPRSLPSAADPMVLEYPRAGSGVIAQASYIFEKPIEIVGRFSRMYTPGGDPKFITEVRNLGQELATGVNYYVNGHQFKFQADWIVRTPRDASFDISDHVAHVQLDAQF